MYYFVGFKWYHLPPMAIGELILLWYFAFVFPLLKIHYSHLFENMQHLHTFSLSPFFFSSFFNSLTHSVLYVVATPVLVTFSLYLVIWWDPFSSRSPRKSRGCILVQIPVGLTLLFCSLEAWRMAWMGLKSLAHTCLEFCKNIISLCMCLLKSLLRPWLFLVRHLGLLNQRPIWFLKYSKGSSFVVRCLWWLSGVEFSRNICTLSVYGFRFYLQKMSLYMSFKYLSVNCLLFLQELHLSFY